MKPQFNKIIFWDVDFDNLDFDLYSNWVIERVFDRGDVEDIRQCRRYYGDEKVSMALLNAKHINDNRIHLAAAVINKPIHQFRCYTQKQLNKGLYPY